MYDQSNDLFSILKYNGKPTGEQKPRGEVHRSGDWHGSVHIWVFGSEGVLLQKRSMLKDAFPGYLDASCTGHIDPGETPEQAAVREVGEELGLCIRPEELLPVLRQHVTNRIPPLYNREINHVFVLSRSVAREELRFQPEEIDALLFLAEEDLSQVLREKIPGYCIIRREWESVRRFLRRRKK